MNGGCTGTVNELKEYDVDSMNQRTVDELRKPAASNKQRYSKAKVLAKRM